MAYLLALLLQEEWKPDASLLDALQAAKAVGSYEMCPPKGYDFARAPQGPKGVESYSWQGTPREDRSTAMLVMALVTPPSGEGPPSLEKFLEAMLNGVKRRRTDWTQSDVERGTVNGLDFIRVRWNGTAQNRKMQGILYAARDGAHFIQLASQDVEPHHEDALKLAEAAILTFRKR